ncbi:MAG TPA: hypothetical protein VFO38_05995 [Candidatus Saccharimonadales bacterium]|nr:hypothetical protein [Candidatus Saccharimonadales bacterium]
MTESVRSQTKQLAGKLEGAAQKLNGALDQVLPLKSSVALLENTLEDVCTPLVTVVENLKEIATLRSQADDAAQARARSLFEEVIRVVAGAKEGLRLAKQYRQKALEDAKQLSAAVGAGSDDGCAGIIGDAASKASGLLQEAESRRKRLEEELGPKHPALPPAEKIRDRTEIASKAVENAHGGVSAACDKIGECKGMISTFEVPDSTPLDTVLSQLQAVDLESSDSLPDASDLESVAATSKQAHKEAGKFSDTSDIKAGIASAKKLVSKASKKLRAV